MDNEMPMGVQFSVLHRSFRRRMDEHARQLGLTGAQMGVLLALNKLERRGGGEINQRALEEATRTTHPTMTEMIRRLEKSGFLSCTVSQFDRRQKSIASTAQTAQLKRDVARLDETVFAELTQDLSEEQIRQLKALLRPLVDNAVQHHIDCCGARKEENAR